MVNENIVLFSGYARLPAGTAASEMYKVMAIVVLVDVKTGIITEADCTLSTALSERFVAKQITGYNLNDGLDALVKRMNDVYQGHAKKAITSALHVIYDKYREYINKSGAQP